MPRYTIITGLFLILLGAYGYLSYDSVTVLIPAFIGFLIMVFGILAVNEKRRRMFIHLAIVIAVIGLSASIKSVLSIPGLIECSSIGDGTIENCSLFLRPLAELFKSLMAIILLPYFFVSIAFFVKARLSK
jgi:hypothetical protein|tara:strand:+ start:3148 stop:3540 length:393 start_codon:yes stop_codon:yes gene_type:complete